MKINQADDYFKSRKLLKAPSEHGSKQNRKKGEVTSKMPQLAKKSESDHVRSCSLSNAAMARGLKPNLSKLRVKENRHVSKRKSLGGFIRISPRPGQHSSAAFAGSPPKDFHFP
jgi:hypothetical protein